MKSDWTKTLPPQRATGDAPTGGVAADVNALKDALAEVRNSVPATGTDLGVPTATQLAADPAFSSAYQRRISRLSVPGEAGLPAGEAPTIGTPVARGTDEADIPAAVYQGSDLVLNPAFTFRGGPWEAVDAWPAVRWPTTVLLSGEQPQAPSVEFLYYGTGFTFGYKGQGWLASRVWVDGVPAQGMSEADSLGQDGGTHAIPVTFTTTAWRHIRLDIAANGFWGLDVAAGDIVAPVAEATGRRLLVIHDSYGEGTGAQYGACSGYTATVGAMLGHDVVNLSQGGTGVLTDNPGAGRVRYRSRAQDWAPAEPTAVLLGLSINDDDKTPQAVADELDVLIPMIAAIPTVRDVWVMGGAPRGSGDVTNKQARDAVIGPRVAAHGATFVSLVSPSALWTSASDATLMWSDGAHPSQAGHDAIGRTFVDRLLAALPA